MKIKTTDRQIPKPSGLSLSLPVAVAVAVAQQWAIKNNHVNEKRNAWPTKPTIPINDP